MQWRFFHELHGSWQWHQLDATDTIAARGGGFATYEECVADAKRHGYVDGSGDDHLAAADAPDPGLARR